MTRLGRTLLLLLLTGAAAGCTGTSATTGAFPATGDGALGQNLAGETCRAAPRPGPSLVPGMAPPLDISCGDSKEAVGTVWTSAIPAAALGSDDLGRLAAIERASKESLAGQRIAERMSCDTGTWVGSGPDVLVYACTLKNAGWPQIVLVTAAGGAIQQAEGLPSLLPVLETAMAQKSGVALSAENSAAVTATLETRVKGDLGRIKGADVAGFDELVRLGRFYNSTQNFAGAEEAFRRAVEVETRVMGPDSESLGATLIELALQISNQGRFDEADALFRRADPIIQRSASDRLHARYIAYLALAAANERKYPEALAFARQATSIRRKLATGDSGDSDLAAVDPTQLGARGELVHSLRIEAAMALRTGDTGAALASISEALELMSSTSGLPLSWRPEALALLSEVDAADGRYAAAKRDLDGAVALSQKLFGPTAPTALVLIKRGRFQTDVDHYADAVRDFHAAFEIIAKDDAARAQLVADSVIPFFASASDLGGKDPQQRGALADDMFRAGQSIGSGVADQTIGRAAARLFTSDPKIEELIRQTQAAERERDTARLELANEQSKPDAERGSIKEAALAKTVQEQSAQADALQRKLLTAFPAYANFAQPGPVGLPELQQRLGGNEAFLAIVVGHAASYAMLVRRDSFAVHRVDVTEASLTDTVTGLRTALTPRLGTLPDYDLEASYGLYKKLLAPFDDRLAGVTHLIVAPSGALASLPFSLLVTAPPAGRHAYAGAHWLIERMAISEVPSPRAFVNLREARAHAKTAPRPFLGVGNPTFTGRTDGANGSALDALAGSCRGTGAVSAELIRALAPLPESADEVRRVGARLGADSNSMLLGPAATEANLRRQALGDYNVLYFATHGLLPGELRCESEPGLALSPPEGGSTSAANDGLLDASEVAGLSLNADLVVLSACNTAAGGGRFGGDALSGLAEAFFYAGARTLVASHWQVPSQATVRLMTGMFDRAGPRLQGGIAESLRQSQLSLASDPATAHPFYWAAFTVIGDGGTPSADLSAQALNQTPAAEVR